MGEEWVIVGDCISSACTSFPPPVPEDTSTERHGHVRETAIFLFYVYYWWVGLHVIIGSHHSTWSHPLSHRLDNVDWLVERRWDAQHVYHRCQVSVLSNQIADSNVIFDYAVALQ